MAILEHLQTLVTFIFLLTILSYYILIFIKTKKALPIHKFSSITIIIPAHNEEKYIGEAIESVMAAQFTGKKQIIVVDDGSIDKTNIIASNYKHDGVKVIKTKHSGKSVSINRALELATGDLVAIVDGDSYIHKDALNIMKIELERKMLLQQPVLLKLETGKN